MEQQAPGKQKGQGINEQQLLEDVLTANFRHTLTAIKELLRLGGLIQQADPTTYFHYTPYEQTLHQLTILFQENEVLERKYIQHFKEETDSSFFSWLQILLETQKEIRDQIATNSSPLSHKKLFTLFALLKYNLQK